jgi:G3E family GTPase
LLLQFWRPPLDARTTSPRVIVVVDAVAMHQGATDATWEAQVDAADLLLLSKVDRVDDGVVQGCIEALGRRTGRAVWPVRRGDVDTDALWGLLPPPRRAPTGKGHATYGTETLHFDDDAPIDDVFRAIRVLRPLRAKGFLRQGSEIVVVQGVGDDLHVEPPRNPPPEELVGLVVVIRAG